MKRRHYEPEHLAFGEAVRAFLEKEVVPHFDEWEAAGITPREIFSAAGANGFLGMAVPEEYGGGGVADFRFNQILGEEVQWSMAGGAALGITLHNDICLPYFLSYCAEEQKARWLPASPRVS
jgi:alkylation response protein AidB-like acyl-CoA dehydrogenase